MTVPVNNHHVLVVEEDKQRRELYIQSCEAGWAQSVQTATNPTDGLQMLNEDASISVVVFGGMFLFREDAQRYLQPTI